MMVVAMPVGDTLLTGTYTFLMAPVAQGLVKGTLSGLSATSPEAVIFGQNAVHQKPGEISVGDEVTVLNQEN